MFSSKLADADAEATETSVWLDFARDCGYLAPEGHRQFATAYDEIGRMLHVMIADPEKFAPRGTVNAAKAMEGGGLKASVSSSAAGLASATQLSGGLNKAK